MPEGFENRITPPLTPYGAFNRLFYRFQRCLAVPFLKLFNRFKVHGPQPPDGGPLMVAANHESLIDPVVLQAAVRRRRLLYMMTSNYYFKPVLNRYSRLMRCIPVMEGKFNREALRGAIDVLNAGMAVGIFPEGAIRTRLAPEAGMRGIAMLASRSGAPVVPARIRGTGIAFPRGARMIKPAAIEVTLGEALDFENAAQSGRAHLRDITQQIMTAIEKL